MDLFVLWEQITHLLLLITGKEKGIVVDPKDGSWTNKLFFIYITSFLVIPADSQYQLSGFLLKIFILRCIYIYL